MLSLTHVKSVVDDVADWGVKSLCFAGGGEPSLHPNFAEIVDYTADTGLEVGISTNGVSLTEKMIEVIAKKARFCGFSIDAGTRTTWQQLKCSEMYDSLEKNARLLGRLSKNTKLDFTYKIMLVPENQNEILSGCKNAKSMGFKSFFVRPAAFENVPSLTGKTFEFDIEAINKQIDACLEMEDDNFKVYYSFGRVNATFHRKNQFDKCRCTPVLAVYCADGYCYLCIDYRERDYARMCKHLELRKFWNSDDHKKMIANIDLGKCPRCAFAHYNQQLEAYAHDYMYVNFP
jgi:MoaA/NifB/PqqE/SkfB family radical SAM enzyme